MAKWTKDNTIGIIGIALTVLPYIGGAIVGWFAWLAQIPVYLIILSVIITICLILFGTNQFESWRERHKKGISSQSNENIEAILRKWIDKRQYKTQHKVDANLMFCFSVIDLQNRPINVLRHKSNSTVIQLVWMLDEKDFEEIPPNYQIIFRHKIAIEMARFGVLCHPSKPLHIILDLPFDDSLTENVFMSGIDRMRQAHVLLTAHVQEVVFATISQQTETKTDNSGKIEPKNYPV